MIGIVAPFVGAWIEIPYPEGYPGDYSVAPFVGAWIEIAKWKKRNGVSFSRSLCGSVD